MTRPMCPQGFLVNRVLIPMINEAFFCLMEVNSMSAAVTVRACVRACTRNMMTCMLHDACA